MSIVIIFLFPLNVFIYLKKQNNCSLLIYVLIFFLFIIISYYYIFVSYLNCDDWPMGLNNTMIDNNLDKYACKIQFPKFCPFKLGTYFLDFSKLKRISCKDNKYNTKYKLLKFSNYKYINENTKHIGFPLFNKDEEIFPAIKDNDNKIIQFVKSHLVDMDNKKLVKDIYKKNIPEIIIDYSKNPYGEININLHFNETLSKERKLLEKNTMPYSDNIMVIYIDSVSRANSIRKLKKTLNFIEQFMPYKGGFNYKYSSENYHSFQFFKYHSIKCYTRNNYLQMFYGNSYRSIKPEKLVRITKYFKENGYVTCFTNDMCLRETTNTGHNMTYDEIGDHEMIICDPNKKSVHSHTARCLYNKFSTEAIYEYSEQFWSKYKKNRKFLSAVTNDGHEGTLEVIRHIDDILFKFLNKIYNENLFKSSTIFLLSDHGTSCPSPYYIYEFFHIEKYLPMLYIITNDRKNISYAEQYENMKNNQQILITGFDIYNTFGHIMYGDNYSLIKNKTKEKDSPKSEFGISLFNKINPKERSPKNYKNMDNYICK